MEFIKQMGTYFVRQILFFIIAIIGTIITIWPLIAVGAIIFIIVKIRKRKNKKD